MNRLFLLTSTHVAAGSLGWLAFHGPANGTTSSDQASGRLGKSTDRQAERQEGLRLLGEMRRSWKVEEQAAQAAAEATENRVDSAARSARESRATLAKEHEEIRRLVEAFVLPADPGAELDRMLKANDRFGSIPLIIAWLKKDPEEALRHLDKADDSFWTGNFTNVLDLWIEHAGAAEAIRLLENAPKWRGQMAEAALKFAVAADPSSLGSLMGSLEGKVDRGTILRSAFSDVPEDKRTAALDWMMTNLKGSEAGKTVAHAAFDMETSGDPAGAKDFLKAAVARLDPEAMQELKGWGNYAQILGYGIGPDSPMEERIEVALLREQTGNSDAERRTQAMSKIVTSDVYNWFRSGVWNEALRAGNVDAVQLWSDCESAFPEFKDSDRDTMLKAFFKQAAIEDPKNALALLKKEGKQDEAAAYVLSTMSASIYSDLEAGIQLAELLHDDDIRGQLAAYDRYYGSSTARATKELGSYWTDWVTRQPAGLNRDLLLHHTAAALAKQGDLSGAAGLRALIQNPEVKNRSTPPP